MMCRACRREGTKLIFFTTDPDEKPIVIESLPSFSSEMQELFELYHELQKKWLDNPLEIP